MDTRWLQDFLTLAEVRNFTRAAELRNLSQAAFSRRIQGLEQWLGARLIDRNAFPTALTEAGELFRDTAADIIAKMSTARTEIAASQDRDQIRLALPYALATTRLPGWWKAWTGGQRVGCKLELGNIHDIVSALIAGSADLLICFQQAAQPVPIDAERYERLVLGTEIIRPYAARSEVEAGRITLPGSAAAPVPLLMYSTTVYFARLVDTVIENAPEKIHGFRAFETELSDAMADLAAGGLGVAWLPESSFGPNRTWDLVALGEGRWDTEVSICAYKERNNQRPVVTRLWQSIERTLTLAEAD